MATTIYEIMLQLVRQLHIEEQHRLAEEIIRAEQQVDAQPKHSIHELRGLRKEVWVGIDVKLYLETERDAWDR